MSEGSFFKHKGPSNRHNEDYLRDLVLISLSAHWDGTVISDQFLWPRANNRVRDMKDFALILLADYLRTEIHNYEALEIESTHFLLYNFQISLIMWPISFSENSISAKKKASTCFPSLKTAHTVRCLWIYTYGRAWNDTIKREWSPYRDRYQHLMGQSFSERKDLMGHRLPLQFSWRVRFSNGEWTWTAGKYGKLHSSVD